MCPAIARATSITWVRSAEPSSPSGVPTAMKTTSEWRTASAVSVVNERLSGTFDQLRVTPATSAEIEGSEITPLTQKLFSTRAEGFESENAEILAAVDQVRMFTQGRGIWAMDRGGDRKKLLEPLLEKKPRFGIRSRGQRAVIHRRQPLTVHRRSARCRWRYPARMVGSEDGPEKRYELR